MKPKRRPTALILTGAFLVTLAIGVFAANRLGSRGLRNILETGPGQKIRYPNGRPASSTYKKIKAATPTAAKIVKNAKSQIGTYYYAAYVSMSYPNGDVPPSKNGTPRGACTDVVIRALRAVGYDLQELIQRDRRRDPGSYPRIDGRADKNIDHRRVPNQMSYFGRHGQTLTKTVSSSTLKQWQPGDIVCWDLGGPLHIGIVSNSVNDYGEPWVIHNIGLCAEEDRLTAWKIIGHYRFPVRGR